ncbi:phosphonate metabolism transcriptional regulator PhnF [Belnapia sp. T6]|uniref:Phosphonate metabolism transcriptional regulator PhnF n=1 Tax=Belnapia mucosa TaxID=2804532 RepID=A0ABS1V4Q7_9PROT|nr:phosphonate metabolism transcriptional regulator PhnF [Belnapia mucosa]
MPLWRQIAITLQTAISGGVFAPGARLPTEAELSARFDVNRHTVRRAMEDLENRGLIRVEQGRGSFVTEDILEYPISARTRFHDNMRRQNKDVRSRFIRIEEMPAEAQIADDLRLRRGRPVILAERLSEADGRPVAIGRHWFPADRFPSIATRLAEAESISKVLAQFDIPDYVRRGTRITARLPTAPEAVLLEQPRILPVQVTHAVNLDLQGNPIEVSIGIYPSNRVQLVIKS